MNRIVEMVRTSGVLWTATKAADRYVPLAGRWPDRRVALPLLREQLRLILEAWHVPEVETVMDHVLYADVHGVDSHGVAMLFGYQRRRSELSARPHVVHDDGATGLVDGGGGLGHLPSDQAMRLAIEKAKEHGLGAVAVRNSGHFGAAGTYSTMAAERGLVGMAMTSTTGPAIVPTYGAEPKLGTNAISFAAGELLLDMATSTSSLGRARVKWHKGRPMPKGWAVTAKGRPMRRGHKALYLTPLGSTPALSSYKGYGLAAMVEVLAHVLGGGVATGHFFLALDPDRFAPGFGERVAGLADDLRSTRPLRPEQSVMLPGDPERHARADREAYGVPLTRSIFEDIRLVARRENVPFLL